MHPLLDTHQHLLYRGKLSYPWSDDLPPLAGQDFTVDDYALLTENKNVAASIFMEVDAEDYKFEANFISKLVNDPKNNTRGLIASCRPEGPAVEFEDWMDECSELPVVGFRRILHEAPNELSETTQFRNNIRYLSSIGKPFDLCVRADQLNIGNDLARACPNTEFVLDHCGVPDIANGEFEVWKTGIAAIAQNENLNCKVSGVLAYCADGEATLEAIKPYVLHIIDSFGPSRLLWGSDWPVVNLRSTLPDWIEIFRALISDLSPDEQEAICFINAKRVYSLEL